MEHHIARWRDFLAQRRALSDRDIDELEDHLRGQVDELKDAGLDDEEAFLVAIKRLGRLDALSREYALEHSDRLWKQLVMAGTPPVPGGANRELIVVLGLAVAAAVSFKVWDLSGLFPLGVDTELPLFYASNAPFFVLPWLCVYFAWKRQLGRAYFWTLLVPFLGALIITNTYPYQALGSTRVLGILHLPIALWAVVGLAYTGARWAGEDGRMDFVRFTGELIVYYVLIALGGWVFVGLTFILFSSIGLDPQAFVVLWLLPAGITGAVIVAAWLVESKQGVIENMVPVLTRVFTPLFTVLLAAFLVIMLVTGQGIALDREVLIAYDLLLALVLGLLLYAISAREATDPPGLFDLLQCCLVVFALVSDLIALASIAGRISEFGFSANRLAALGENLVLLVNLSWSAVLYYRFLRDGQGFSRLVRWQMGYLPVYFLWAACVVIVFPPLFAFA